MVSAGFVAGGSWTNFVDQGDSPKPARQCQWLGLVQKNPRAYEVGCCSLDGDKPKASASTAVVVRIWTGKYVARRPMLGKDQ